MEGKKVQDMFHSFNQKYFWGKLSNVRLNWSENMTLCAGKTYYKERQGNATCSIYLSQPLLSQRPPEDTVNTLLHEMIHAYLMKTRGRSHKMGHGPEFKEHMTRINKLHGSKITVFHNFRKEVDKFRVHVYRCDGPCTKKRPYFGVLRRAITRPPGPTDRWWAKHSQECGGTFHKVEGPDMSPDIAHDTNEPPRATLGGSPSTPSPQYTPCTPSPQYTPITPYPKYTSGTSSPQYTPCTPSPQYMPSTPYPKYTSSSPSTQHTPHTPSPKNTPYPRYTSGTPSPQHTPRTPTTKHTLSQKVMDSGLAQSGGTAGRDTGHAGNTSLGTARKRLTHHQAKNTEEATGGEDELIQKIKERHAHTRRSVLLSEEETRMRWRGPSPERGTWVEGRVNHNYKPRSGLKLNIHKYLKRYRAVREAAAGTPRKTRMSWSPEASPETQKSTWCQSSGVSTSSTEVTQLQHTVGDGMHGSASLRTGSSAQAVVPPSVTCWNCGVNVLVPEHVHHSQHSREEESSREPQKVSSPQRKDSGSDAATLVACPSCGEKVREEELGSHLNECLMPFTDDF